KTNAQHTAQLLADLDSPKFRVRQQATQELEYLGRYVLADLAKALKGKPNLEVAVRLDQLVKKIRQPPLEIAYGWNPGVFDPAGPGAPPMGYGPGPAMPKGATGPAIPPGPRPGGPDAMRGPPPGTVPDGQPGV